MAILIVNHVHRILDVWYIYPQRLSFQQKVSDGILYNLKDMLLIWLIMVCNAHMKIFVLHMRNIDFIFIIYLYYYYNSFKKNTGEQK